MTATTATKAVKATTSMTSMNISLPKELKDYVERRTSGSYSTPSEFIRDLIRRDREKTAQERFEDMIEDGLNSEPMVADEKYWAEFKAEIAERRRHEDSLALSQK